MSADFTEWVREYWPWMVGAIIIVVGHAWLYVLQDASWTPLNPALILALVVVVAIELVRDYLSDGGNGRKP